MRPCYGVRVGIAVRYRTHRCRINLNLLTLIQCNVDNEMSASFQISVNSPNLPLHTDIIVLYEPVNQVGTIQYPVTEKKQFRRIGENSTSRPDSDQELIGWVQHALYAETLYCCTAQRSYNAAWRASSARQQGVRSPLHTLLSTQRSCSQNRFVDAQSRHLAVTNI